MNELLWLLILLGVYGVTAYKQTSSQTTLIAISVAMVIGTVAGGIGVIGWILFAIVVIPLAYAPFRKDFISTKLLAFYKSVMPEMSTTEQEAIDAGTVWWDGDIFSGKPDWQKFHAISQPRLTPDEQAFIDGPCEVVSRMADEWQINHVDADMSDEIWQYLKDNKFFAMMIKKEYGGLAFSAYAQSRVLQK